MPKGRKSSFVIRVDAALLASVEERPEFRDLSRTEIANYALTRLNDGLAVDRMRSWSLSLINAVARVCGAEDVIVTFGSSVEDGRITHSLGAMIDGKMVHDLPVLED